jgi:hypothetical protein
VRDLTKFKELWLCRACMCKESGVERSIMTSNFEEPNFPVLSRFDEDFEDDCFERHRKGKVAK